MAPPHELFTRLYAFWGNERSVAAAQKNQCKNNEPYTVVVEQVAKAVIHNSFLLMKLQEQILVDICPMTCPSDIMLCRKSKKVRAFCRFLLLFFCVIGIGDYPSALTVGSEKIAKALAFSVKI